MRSVRCMLRELTKPLPSIRQSFAPGRTGVGLSEAARKRRFCDLMIPLASKCGLMLEVDDWQHLYELWEEMLERLWTFKVNRLQKGGLCVRYGTGENRAYDIIIGLIALSRPGGLHTSWVGLHLLPSLPLIFAFCFFCHRGFSAHTHVHIHTCTHAHMCTCTHTHMHTRTYTYAYAYA
eukprot:GHVU01034517.1.p1 GENE.GHVU01034517.1~~GHVU01034517.1.p1  ORF type:complete len:178 (+),score=0.94 GHVU01034517.1:378-911(+)